MHACRYNEAQNFWKKQAATLRARSAGSTTIAPPLDMSTEAVAARARATRSCCFATNQRPQVPRLRGVPSGPLGPNTPHTGTSSDQQNPDAQTDDSSVASHSESDPVGPGSEFDHRMGQFSSSSGTSIRSLRDDFSLGSGGGASSLLQSPGTPDPGRVRCWDLPQRRGTVPACLDTIISVCEDDSGPLTTSTVDSEWTLSVDGSDSEADSGSVSLSNTAQSAPRSVLQYVTRFEAHSASLSERSLAADPMSRTVPQAGTETGAAGNASDAEASAHPLSHCMLQSDMCRDTDSSCSSCMDDAQGGDAEAAQSAPLASDSQLDTVRVRQHEAHSQSVSSSDSESAGSSHARDDISDSCSSVCDMEQGDPATVTDTMMDTASSQRVSEASGVSTQPSLSLSAEALVYESNDGNNPLFWDSHAETGCDGEPGEDLVDEAEERRAVQELQSMFGNGAEHIGTCTGDDVHAHERGQGDFDVVHASASCMLEQPMQCWQGSQHFNPLPMLTVDRTPSQSPDPFGEREAGRHGGVVCSPTASNSSSCSSADSVLADALRSAQHSIHGAQQGAECNMESVRVLDEDHCCLLYTSPSPRDRQKSRMPSSA